MLEPDFDIVHTITDWYDGARGGIATLEGKPHYYECRWDEEKDEWSEVYLLQQIDDETFRLAMEDWGIWLRWEAAYREGRTSHDTHPALPEERARHNELASILSDRLVISPESATKAKGDFQYGQPTLVKWTVVSDRRNPTSG